MALMYRWRFLEVTWHDGWEGEKEKKGKLGWDEK
jgi:hypothetical protein